MGILNPDPRLDYIERAGMVRDREVSLSREADPQKW